VDVQSPYRYVSHPYWCGHCVRDLVLERSGELLASSEGVDEVRCEALNATGADLRPRHWVGMRLIGETGAATWQVVPPAICCAGHRPIATSTTGANPPARS
jgi:hypothetical protein